MPADLQFVTSNKAGTAVPEMSFLEEWPRLSPELTGLSVHANESHLPHSIVDRQKEVGAKGRENGGSQEGSEPQVSQEYPTCPKPDPAVLWMDRIAAALRVLKEAIVLTGILLPGILGARVVDAALALFAPPDSPKAG